MRPPTLTERVVDCSGGDEISEESGFQRKAEALLGLLGQEKSARTLIFCNKIPTCRKVQLCLLDRAPCFAAVLLRPSAAQAGPGAMSACAASQLPCFSWGVLRYMRCAPLLWDHAPWRMLCCCEGQDNVARGPLLAGPFQLRQA